MKAQPVGTPITEDTAVHAYRLRCLGDTHLSASDGTDCTPRGRKTRALLVYVLLSNGPVGRERLATLLWGDRGEEQARASVRQALYELRNLSSGPAPLLSVTREHVIASSGTFSIDIDAAESLARAGNVAALNEALPRQQLALLSDLNDITPDFDDWLRSERTQRIDRLIASAITAGQAALQRGEIEPVRALVTTLEGLDPLSEPAVRLGLQADSLSGDPTSAHRRYRRFEERLKQELATKPSAETWALLPRPRAVPRLEPEQIEKVRIETAPAETRAVDAPSGELAPDSLPTAETGLESRTVSGAKESGSSTRWYSRLWLRVAVPVLLIGLAIAAAYSTGFFAPPPPEPSIAILPFRELPPRGQHDYFASGISEEILNLLAGESRLRVLGSTSARLFAAQPDSRAVARSLGVSYLLEGSVRSQGKRVLVSVRLIRASDGTQVWVEEYDRALDDIFAVQEEIGAAVAQRLSSSLVPPSNPNLATSPSVYDRYLQAQALLRERREESIVQARRLLLEAVTLDPKYAPAWARLSVATILLSDQPVTYGSIPLAQARSEALEHAKRALRLAPQLAAAHAAMGLLSPRGASAIPHFERAIALDPQQGEYYRWLGQAYATIGRQREALEQYQRSADTEPLWWLTATQLMDQLAHMGRENEVEAVVQKFASVSRVPFDVDLVRLHAFHLRGEYEEAISLGRRMMRQRPGDESTVKLMTVTLACVGDRESALATLQPDDVLMRAIINHDVPQIEAIARESPSVFWFEEHSGKRPGELLVADGRGKLLVQLFDARYGSIERLMVDLGDGVSAAPALIVALREAGRLDEAADLNRYVLQRVRSELAQGVEPRTWSLEYAQHLALAGDRAGALAELERLMQTRWTDLLQPPFIRIADFVAFRDLRSDSRMTALQQRLDRELQALRARLNLPRGT